MCQGKQQQCGVCVTFIAWHLIRLKSRETVGHFPANTRGTFHQYIEVLWVVVLAQFSERSLQTHEDPGSNPTFGNFYKEHLLTYC